VRGEEYQTKAQIQQMGQQMDTITKQMETEKQQAGRAKKLVSSLFPSNVHDRILEQIEQDDSTTGPDVEDQNDTARTKSDTWKSEHVYDVADEVKVPVTKGKAIADLFPDATISFADIVGFTAWSSTREPTQVFELLETVYRAFDK
jgi:class 3 adenylate cyclase